MGKPANFAIVGESNDVFLIRDLGPWDVHFTITNDAEGVVRRLAGALQGRKLLYFDSEGDVAELKVKDGRFAGFGAIFGAAFLEGEQT
jgi:hypothetical protein